MARISGRLIALITIIAPQPGATNEVIDARIGVFTLGSRMFDVSADISTEVPMLAEDWISLTRIDWIEDLVRSDPVLFATSIKIEDRSDHGTPVWLPDGTDRLHADTTLPPLFNVPGYNVFWRGVEWPYATRRLRGDITLISRSERDRYFVTCGWDRNDAVPILCHIHLRYRPDRNLFVTIRIGQLTNPLPDFKEIADRVEGLILCLDITDPTDGAKHQPKNVDIVPGGKCRPTIIS